MAARYVVRERTLPARLAAARPTLTVYDVTEEHTARAVYHGVHTAWGRAYLHAKRLNNRSAEEAERAAQVDAEERAADRVRIAARERQQEERKPRPRRGRRGRRRGDPAPPPRTAPWDGSLDDAVDIIARVRAAGGSASYTCADPAECWRQGGRSPHAIRVTAPAEVTVWAGGMPPPTVGR